MHVDDFTTFGTDINSQVANEKYARWFLMLHRLPAVMRSAFVEWIRQYELYCMYKSKPYRVTGASRLGNIFLSENLEKDAGYDICVDVGECSNWMKNKEELAARRTDLV